VAIGLGLCLSGGEASTATAPDPPTGNAVAALCGVTWALTLLGLRWGEGRQVGTVSGTVIAGNVFAFLVGLPTLWRLPAASAVGWATLGYLGVFQIGVAYIWLASAVRHLSALQVSLLLLLEPVLNPVWAWLVRGEDPGGRVLAGGAIILAASAGHVLSDARGPEAPSRTPA